MLEFGEPEEFTRRDAVRHQVEILEKEIKEYQESIEGKQTEWEASLTEEQIGEMGPRVQEVLAVPMAERNEEQQRAGTAAFRRADPGWSARGKWWRDGEYLCRRWDTGDEQCITICRIGENKCRVRTKNDRFSSEFRMKK